MGRISISFYKSLERPNMMNEQKFTGINEQSFYDMHRLAGDKPAFPMEYQQDELKPRTMQSQLGFNKARIEVLHKEFQELKQMLSPYIINVPKPDTQPKDSVIPGEVNSEMMYSLILESTMLNDLIEYVAELKKDLQL